MQEACREKIVSEEYVDVFWRNRWGTDGLDDLFTGICRQTIGTNYEVLYVKEDLSSIPYEWIPALYGLMQTEHLEASGILQLQTQPYLNLSGKGVIVGFVDTGIDYRNECFRDSFGDCRILEIWDQSDQSGKPPEKIQYGSVYTMEELNRALESEDPLSVVPTRDVSGHGTKLAAIAAGSVNVETGWVGAAPESWIAMVKLKEAKQQLKEYFAVKEDAIAFQENDVMLGIRYLHELALRKKLPLVICLALGTNLGGHDGTSPLAGYLNYIGSFPERCIVVAGGNEANAGHHFGDRLRVDSTGQDVEFRVADGENGLFMEVWSNTPDMLSVAMRSPTGEWIPRSYGGNGRERYSFVFEPTVVDVEFVDLVPGSGEQVVVIRMIDPTPGIWNLRIYGDQVSNGEYHVWLPITGFITSETRFLASNPDTTLTEPSNAEGPITVGAYRVPGDSIYVDSGRGYTRSGRFKPDLVAPGVEVQTYGPEDRDTKMTGTSVAAAITAGASALLMEWAVGKSKMPGIGGQEIKQLLIRGAVRRTEERYPNPVWGYGMLDLYGSFEVLGRF